MFPENRLFSFLSMACPGDTFDVVSFTIDEGINRFFRMELLLCSRNHAIDFDEIIDTPASCVTHALDGNIPVQGLISEFEQLHCSHGLAFYRAVLSPRLWWMTIGRHSQVFLDMTVPQILETVLNQGGLEAPAFSFKLQHDYPVREMVCQYNESHYDFFMRWLEREGMYYYFQRKGERAEIVITDTAVAHTELRRHKTVRYAPPSGLRRWQDSELVYGLVCRRHPVPSHVRLCDRNYKTPTLDISCQHCTNESGLVENYEYGGHILTPGEGQRLARVRSEAIKAHAVSFYGESSLHSMRGGFIFSLENHFREDFNRDYLVVSCRHTGNQAAYLEAGIRRELEGLVEEGPMYQNSFTAIPADMQYRPLPETPWPRIHGYLSGKVDGSGSGQYADIDDQGRYKIILPFDISGRKDGHASCWVRMAQPYAGTNHGLHFPLHKGAEVLLAFEAGDPDRPVIAGALPSLVAPSPVTQADHTMCKITTSGQNKLHFEDQEGSQRILMSTPTSNTWLRLGSPNDPPAAAISDEEHDTGFSGWKKREDGVYISTEGHWYGMIGHTMEIKVGGNSREMILGGEETFIGGYESSIVVGARTDITVGGILDIEIGGKLEINLAYTREIRPKKLTVFEAEHHCTNIYTEIHEIDHRVGAVERNVRDHRTELNDRRDEITRVSETMAEHERQIIASQNAIIENREAIHENEVAISGTRQQLTEDELRIATNYTELKESHTALGESMIQIVNDAFSSCQESIEVLQSKVFI